MLVSIRGRCQCPEGGNRALVTARATRNARLAAVRSLFNFASLRHPEHAELIARVLAIQAKRGTRGIVCFLNRQETNALLKAPDRSTPTGRRDHLMLALDVQTGARRV